LSLSTTIGTEPRVRQARSPTWPPGTTPDQRPALPPTPPAPMITKWSPTPKCPRVFLSAGGASAPIADLCLRENGHGNLKLASLSGSHDSAAGRGRRRRGIARQRCRDRHWANRLPKSWELICPLTRNPGLRLAFIRGPQDMVIEIVQRQEHAPNLGEAPMATKARSAWELRG
jgi:hypothetical protein